MSQPLFPISTLGIMVPVPFVARTKWDDKAITCCGKSVPAHGGAECRVVVTNEEAGKGSLGPFVEMALEPGQCSGRKYG